MTANNITAAAEAATHDKMLSEFMEMYELKRDLEAELKSVTERIGELEPPLLEYFALTGTERVTRNGLTAFLHSQLWAKIEEGATKADVIEGLREAGLADYVSETYNSNQVSALLREWAEQELPIPGPLQGKLGATEKHSIRVRKA